jgi:hypothetical protein
MRMSAPAAADPGEDLEGHWDIWGGANGERWYAARREPVTAAEADAGCPPFIGAGDRDTLADRIRAWEETAAKGRASPAQAHSVSDLAVVIGQLGGKATITGRAVQAIEVRRPDGGHPIVMRTGWKGDQIAWVWDRAGCAGHAVPQDDAAGAAAAAMDCAAGHPARRGVQGA